MNSKKANREAHDKSDSPQPDERPPVVGRQSHPSQHTSRHGDTADWHAQLAEDRATSVKPGAPGSNPVGGLSSANSVTADPFSREKALGAPVQQVTRKI